MDTSFQFITLIGESLKFIKHACKRALLDQSVQRHGLCLADPGFADFQAQETRQGRSHLACSRSMLPQDEIQGSTVKHLTIILRWLKRLLLCDQTLLLNYSMQKLTAEIAICSPSSEEAKLDGGGMLVTYLGGK